MSGSPRRATTGVRSSNACCSSLAPSLARPAHHSPRRGRWVRHIRWPSGAPTPRVSPMPARDGRRPPGPTPVAPDTTAPPRKARWPAGVSHSLSPNPSARHRPSRKSRLRAESWTRSPGPILLDPKRTVQIGIRGAQNTEEGWDFSVKSGMRVIFMEAATQSPLRATHVCLLVLLRGMRSEPVYERSRRTLVYQRSSSPNHRARRLPTATVRRAGLEVHSFPS
jgi:hypothetical protein